MQEKISNKVENADMGIYKVFGICNPALAYKAIQTEKNIGVFLPCKLIIRQIADNSFEIASFNPELMMGVLGNTELDSIAQKVTTDLKAIIAAI